MKFKAFAPNCQTEINAADWTEAKSLAERLAWILRTSVTLVSGSDGLVVTCPKVDPTVNLSRLN